MTIFWPIAGAVPSNFYMCYKKPRLVHEHKITRDRNLQQFLNNENLTIDPIFNARPKKLWGQSD